MKQKETILGVDVSNETYESLIEKAFYNIEEKNQSFIVAVNPEKIIKAQDDPDLRGLINAADFQIPDGVGVLIGSRLQHGQIRSRITGVDLMMELCKEAEKQGKSIFLYGGKPGVAEAAKENLTKRLPQLYISGVLDGYQSDKQGVLNQINAASPDILFVALGSPRQEEWIRENKQNLNVSIFQGVGGSFDVLAGNVKRAPSAFRKLGLEWLYRLLREPWRIKRQIALPKFLAKILFSKNK